MKDNRIGMVGKGKGKNYENEQNQVEKLDDGEGNQVSGNLIHP